MIVKFIIKMLTKTKRFQIIKKIIKKKKIKGI
jgi:hypothetical protein